MFNPQLFGAQIGIDLISLASYAFTNVGSAILRRSSAQDDLIDSCAERLATPKTQLILGIWGLTLTIALPWIAIAFFKSRHFALLGLALVPVAAVLVGLALGIAATWVESSRSELYQASTNRWSGIVTIVLAAALPILGWLVFIACLLPALGAIAEYLVSPRQKTRPYPEISQDRSESTDITVSNNSENVA